MHVVALGCASSVWPSDKIVEALLPVLKDDAFDDGDEDLPSADEEQRSDLEEGGPVVEQSSKGRWGSGEAKATFAWLGPKHKRENLGIPRPLHARCLAAAALQMLRKPLSKGSDLANEFSSLLADLAEDDDAIAGLQVQAADWVLEALLAVPAVLSSCEAVFCLTPFLRVPVPRAQLNACIALYSVALRREAPSSHRRVDTAFQEALSKIKTEAALLSLIEFWAEEWAGEARRRLQERLKRPRVVRDRGGRYALAEALRCVGCFASREVAEKAAVLAGADRDLFCAGTDEAWRRQFVRFVERFWKCPITSPHSPF